MIVHAIRLDTKERVKVIESEELDGVRSHTVQGKDGLIQLPTRLVKITRMEFDNPTSNKGDKK